MRRIFFTPGPTQLHPCVAGAVTRALEGGIVCISHRGVEFQELFSGVKSALREVFGLSARHHIFCVGSATEAMERIIQNLAAHKSFHFVNGAFSERFFSIASELRRKPVCQSVALGEGFNLKEAQIDATCELVCITQSETSTGVILPEEDIHTLKRRYPEKLFALDVVSSAPICRLDFSLIDCAFFSVQKCFGLPSGLGIIILNERCLEKAKELEHKGVVVGSYHSFRELEFFGGKNQTPETPNILAIYLLGVVCREFLREGLEGIRLKLHKRAAALYSLLERQEKLNPFVKNPEFRSKTVITVEVKEELLALRTRLENLGLVVGSGYGELKDRQIRIANFPSHSDSDFNRLLEALG